MQPMTLALLFSFFVSRKSRFRLKRLQAFQPKTTLAGQKMIRDGPEASLSKLGWQYSFHLIKENLKGFEENIKIMSARFLKEYKTFEEAKERMHEIRNSLKKLVLSTKDIETLESMV